MDSTVERLVGRDGRRKLVFYGQFEPEFVQELRKDKIDDIIFSSGIWSDLRWVADSGVHVSRIIINEPFESYRGLEQINGLRELSIQGTLKGVDVTELRELSSLEVDWSRALGGKLSSLPLQSLTLTSYCRENADEFGRISSLKKLDLRRGTIQTLAGLEQCHSLEHLELALLTKLRDISAIGALSCLKVLKIEKCSKIDDFTALVRLRNLEYLHIEGGSQEISDDSIFRQMTMIKQIMIDLPIKHVDWRRLLCLQKLEKFTIAVFPDQVINAEELAAIIVDSGRQIINFKVGGTKKRPWVNCVLEPPKTFQ